MGEFVNIAKANDLSENSGMLVEVQNRQIALFRSEEGYCAIDDASPHGGGPFQTARWTEMKYFACGKAPDSTSRPVRLSLHLLLSGGSAYVVRVKGDDVEIEL